MMTFKEKLVVLRKIKHLTQDEFASAVGVSRQAVYKWESGQSYPEVQKLIEMKLLFGISIDDLLDDTFEIELPKKKKKRRSKKADAEAAEIKAEETLVAKPETVEAVEEAKEPEVSVAAVSEEIPAAAPAPVKAEPIAEKVVVKEEPKVEAPKEAPKPASKAEPAPKTESSSYTKKSGERVSLFERLFGTKK